MTTEDRWAALDRQFMKITLFVETGQFQAQCKFPEEGRRCNALFKGLNCRIALTRHLAVAHDYFVKVPHRFSNTIGRRRS
jgi:hypothetical protein